MTTLDANMEGQPPLEGRWIALSVLLIANFMNLMDVTIVNVSLPSLRRELGATPSDIEWVVAAYILTFALGLLPFGRLGDMIGRRTMFLAGVALFTLFSALCGMAPNAEVLIAGRVLQGAAAAMMAPQTLAIAQVVFPPHERASAFATFGIAASLAAVTGPTLGGLLISADIAGLAWRPIFLVNVPIGIFAIVAGLRFIPSISGHRQLGIDIVGIALAAVTILLVLFPMIEGRGLGWPLWCFIMIAAALPAGIVFTLWERRQARVGGPQLLPMSLLTTRTFVIGSALGTIFFSGIPGFFLILALFLQEGFGFTPLHSGLTTMPFPLGIMTASLASRWFGHRWLRKRLLVGSALMAVIMFVLRYIVGGLGDSVSSFDLTVPLYLAGLGMGGAIGPIFQLALSGAAPRDAGSASGGMQSFQQLGGAIGVAIVGEIFFLTLLGHGAPGHTEYVAALRAALIYEIVAFLIVAVAVHLVMPKADLTNRPAPPPPVVE